MANVNTAPQMTSYDYGHQEKMMKALKDTLDFASLVSKDCVNSIANMKESMYPICQGITYTNAVGKIATCDLYVLKTWNQGQANFGLAVVTEDGNLWFKPHMSNSLVMSLVGCYMDHMELDYLRSVGERRMRAANATNFLANCKSWNPYSKTVA